MGNLQEFDVQAELSENHKCRGMDGCAAKIAKEIGVFLKDFHADARSGQQEPEHHARRSATGDADLTSRLASPPPAPRPGPTAPLFPPHLPGGGGLKLLPRSRRPGGCRPPCRAHR